MSKTDVYYRDPIRALLPAQSAKAHLERCPRGQYVGSCHLDNSGEANGCPIAIKFLESEIASRDLGSPISNRWTEVIEYGSVSLVLNTDHLLSVRGGKYMEIGFDQSKIRS